MRWADEGAGHCSSLHSVNLPLYCVFHVPISGFLIICRLGEDLVPFLDTSFTDPGAARLAASLKRKPTAAAVTRKQVRRGPN